MTAAVMEAAPVKDLVHPSLVKMRDILAEAGWTQYQNIDPGSGNVCLGQAVVLATGQAIRGIDHEEHWSVHLLGSALPTEISLLGIEVNSVLAKYVDFPGGLVGWNDVPSRTYEQVMSLMNRIIDETA